MRQRSEQNGRKRLAGVASTGFLQIGQRIVTPITVEIASVNQGRNCQIEGMRATPPSIDLPVALLVAAGRNEVRGPRVVAVQFTVAELAIIGAAEVELDVDDHSRNSVANVFIDRFRYKTEYPMRDRRRNYPYVFSVGSSTRVRQRFSVDHHSDLRDAAGRLHLAKVAAIDDYAGELRVVQCHRDLFDAHIRTLCHREKQA